MAITSPKKKDELKKQFKINPEINTKLEAFMAEEPGLVEFVKELPREHLERKFLLGKMKEQERKQSYDEKIKSWLHKPEQEDLLKSLMAAISPNMSPEKQERMLITQGKNYVKNTGLRL